MITEEQLQQVLDDLPPLGSVSDEFYRVLVREYPQVTPRNDFVPSRDRGRFFGFRKNGRHWVLVSVPQIETAA